jgi:protein gp37
MRETNIEWPDSTVNPTTGCEGCELWNGRDIRTCYAGNMHENRLAKSLKTLYAPNFQEVRQVPGRMAKAAAWSDLRGTERPDKPWLNGLPRLIFVGDMGDFCSKQVPDDYIKREIFGAIESKNGQRHFWLLLTKQIARLASLSEKWGGLPDNCMAMTTVTTQPTADTRIPALLKVRCKWHGVSAGPLWGPVGFGKWLPFRPTVEQLGSGLTSIALRDCPKINWVIVEGEDGASYKNPMNPAWAQFLRDQCVKAGVPFFFKQWGNQITERQAMMSGIYRDLFDSNSAGVSAFGNEMLFRVRKEFAGSKLDGVEWKQMPNIGGNQ